MTAPYHRNRAEELKGEPPIYSTSMLNLFHVQDKDIVGVFIVRDNWSKGEIKIAITFVVKTADRMQERPEGVLEKIRR